MNNDKRLSNIIEALSKHDDSEAIGVLEEIGTNCSDDEVRRLTSKALINRNSNDSLSVVITKPGKGINDLNTNVAMSSINELLALKDKAEAIKILTDTEENNENESVKETARSVKALMDFC
ncbi:MAG: hypothetical protein PHC64_10210 [Candidatus Gastranaerophilales bacterium]|nr:hypothetical protein [Candidatus Gastranaerophilales bacterium]